MFAKTAVEKPELILGKEKIKETLLRIITYSLDFVALGVVEKTTGKRFLVCETGFRDPLWKTPGGRPKISGVSKENPLDTISREIKEETGIITFEPKVEDIFLIQKLKNRQGGDYYGIAFNLQYYSGEEEKGEEIAELREFAKDEVSDAISSNKMVPLHIPIWKYYINNLWK